ncbi:hypothetical protein Ae406Ps2_2741c [Pseudonocardia sp. Ae406_Ps2]|nr:hypothetical protein Ae406Ps2_2741c [Pseudonocardia sp. Ae406_Ps2]
MPVRLGGRAAPDDGATAQGGRRAGTRLPPGSAPDVPRGRAQREAAPTARRCLGRGHRTHLPAVRRTVLCLVRTPADVTVM